MGITDRHSGHSLVVGSDGVAGGAALRCTNCDSFTTVIKMAKATMTNFSISPSRSPIRKRQMCHCVPMRGRRHNVDNRHDEIVDDRVNHTLKRCAQHECHRQVDHVSLECKGFELAPK